MAKEQGIDITVEQAANFLNPPKGELSDEELDNGSGGYCKQGGSSHGREIVTLITPCVHGLKKYRGGWVGPAKYYDFGLEFTNAFLNEDLRIAVDIWQVIQIWPESKSYHHRPIEGGTHKYRDSLPVCRSARGRIAVTPEGEVLPCNQLSGVFKKHGIGMGNVHEKPLKELLTDGEYLKTVCYTVGQLREENPKCQACSHWKLCLGGCRALGMVLGGDYKNYDPAKCVYFNEYFGKFAALFNEEWRCVDDIG